MRYKATLVITVVVLVSFIFGTLIGCDSKPPATKNPIKIGYIMPMTGPAAEKGAPIGQGELDAIKYIKDELGGVEGNKLEALWYDSNYDTAKAATIIKKLMDDGCAMFTVVSSKEATAVKEMANRAGFPGLIVFSSPALTHPPQHLYAQLPDYGDDWAGFAKYYVGNIWKGSGKPKMALELLSNPTGYGARDAARAAADSLGIEIVATEEHAATTVSEIDALTRIKAKNPDVLFISSTPAPTAIILKNAYELKMVPGITVGCAHASFTKALVDLAGKDASEGAYGVIPTVNWGDNVPGMAKLVEYCKIRHPEYTGNTDYLIGWASSLINAEIIRQALKNAGYDVIGKGDTTSWQAVEKSGFMRVKGYDVGGLEGPVDFSDPLDKRGSKALKIYQVKTGSITAITDWVNAPLIKYEELSWFK